MMKMASKIYLSTIHIKVNFFKTLTRDRVFVLIVTNVLFENQSSIFRLL